MWSCLLHEQTAGQTAEWRKTGQFQVGARCGLYTGVYGAAPKPQNSEALVACNRKFTPYTIVYGLSGIPYRRSLLAILVWEVDSRAASFRLEGNSG